MNMYRGLLDTGPAEGTRGPRRAYASSGSLVLHGAILFSLVVGSYLRVEPLAEPTFELAFIFDPPAPGQAPPPPPPPSGSTSAAHDQVSGPERMLEEKIPPEAPAVEEVAGEQSGERAIEGGLEGGIDGGVPGGGLNGQVGGIPGGDGAALEGVPGSPLRGLPGDDQPLYLTGAVKPPERLIFVRPEYPETARRARVEGKVILQIVVNGTGDVDEVKVLKSDPLFDEAAVDAVRRWKYRPAMQGEGAVKVYMTVVVDFKLK